MSNNSKKRAIKNAKAARGGDAQFLPLPMRFLRSQQLIGLSPNASKLLIDMCSQWHLGANGDISIAFEKVMRPRGWRSKATLHKAINELRERGIIILTRQGGLHQCSLYGLGWIAIDDCKGKLDIEATTWPKTEWTPTTPIKNISSTPRVPNTQKKVALGSHAVPSG